MHFLCFYYKIAKSLRQEDSVYFFTYKHKTYILFTKTKFVYLLKKKESIILNEYL